MRRLRWQAVVGALVAAVILVLVVAHFAGASHHTRPVGVGSATTEPPAESAPSAPTVEGAVAAAVHNVVAAEQLVRMTEEGAAAAQRAMASSAAADGLAKKMRDEVRALDTAFGGQRPRYRVAVVGVSVTSSSGPSVAVSVWYVGLVVPPNGTAYQDWRRADLRLVWERAAWRLDAEDDRPGPRPPMIARAASADDGDFGALVDRYAGIMR